LCFGTGTAFVFFFLKQVKEIEIYRGAGPAKFGNTLGGVVNIVTKEPTETAKTFEFGLRQEWFQADNVYPAAFGFQWNADVTDMSENTMDPRLAVTYLPWESGSICGRVGITHRYPTSPEYFWWYLNKGTGFFNSDFNPERAVQYELSILQSIREGLDITVRGYYYDIEDYISSTTVSGDRSASERHPFSLPHTPLPIRQECR
jgi:outer membrane receptor protein involved in Fe transport